MNSFSYPAYSIGTSQRTFNLKTEAAEVPGPGSYKHEPFRKTNPPSWRIGTAKRTDEGRLNVPGPGAYDSPGKISRKAPKYHMGMRTSVGSSTDRAHTPGPGTYDYKLIRSTDMRAPSYTIRHKSMSFDPERRSDSPGPAAYNQSCTLLSNRAPIAKIGNSKRENLYTNEDTPGPGTYQIAIEDLRATKNGPAWGFGSSERASTVTDLQAAPGPGAYEFRSTIDTSKAKGANIVSRRPDTSQALSSYIPGPGAYNQSVSNVKLRAPSVKIGRATRDPLSKELCNVPGPGAYQPPINKRSVTSVRIGTSTRNPLSETMANPGPGTYTYDETSHGPKHVIVPKRQDVSQNQKNRNTPGPGAYVPNFNMVRSSTPLLRIGTAKRDERSGTAESPGPAVYDVRRKLTGPKWGFGSEKRGRQSKKDNDPGPGAYELQSRIANLPKYAMGTSLKSSRY